MYEFPPMKALPSLLLILALLAAPALRADLVSEMVPKAEAGDLVAQVELGKIYAKGEGVAKDEKEAVKWYLKAAEQGNLEAQMFLGAVYIRGKGVPKSSKDSAKWYLLAAEQGNATAQCQVSRMHLSGAGVPKDDIQAYKWANLAAAQGDMAAKKVVMILETRMTAEEILQAKEHEKVLLELKKLDEEPPAEEAPALEPIKPEDLEPDKKD